MTLKPDEPYIKTSGPNDGSQPGIDPSDVCRIVGSIHEKYGDVYADRIRAAIAKVQGDNTLRLQGKEAI